MPVAHVLLNANVLSQPMLERPNFPAPESPSVSFIVPVRNDEVRLRKCLQSLEANRSSGVDVEIIVVDNGSTDGSRAVARAAGAHVLECPGLRVSELRNRGLPQPPVRSSPLSMLTMKL